MHQSIKVSQHAFINNYHSAHLWNGGRLPYIRCPGIASKCLYLSLFSINTAPPDNNYRGGSRGLPISPQATSQREKLQLWSRGLALNSEFSR